MPRPRALKLLPWLAPVVAVAVLLVIRAQLVVDPLDRLTRAAAGPGDPANAVVYTGSIDITRGGPVLIGFQGPGSKLWLAGAPVTHDCRAIDDGQLCRVIVPSGAAALRFAAAQPDARLVWAPVGRRGDPTYVQPGSLSPEPPERAEFPADPDAAVADGVVAGAIFAVVVATLLALVRRRLARVSRATWLAMAAVFAVAVVVRWLGLSDHGQTWDEDVNWAAGRNYVTNLLALDFRARSWSWNFQHPPVMKYLEGIPAQLGEGYGAARAMSAVWVAVGCALMVPIGARLYAPRVGWLAGGIAALLPPLVAHGQIVGHEAPTVMWWALGVLLAVTMFDDLPAEPDRASRRTLMVRLAWLGVACGVAFSSRFVNGLLGPTCLVILLVRAPAAWRVPAVLGCMGIASIAAGVTFYAIWPRLWLRPFAALAESYAKLAATHSKEPFLGEMTEQPGVSYFPLYLLATLPLGVLAGAVAGAVRTGRARDPWATAVAMGAWLVFPLAVMASPVRQDGVRYVLPSVMALAMLAAAGWEDVASRLARRVPALARRGYPAVVAVVTLYLAQVLWRTHPYYLDYFGEQVGGAETVAGHRWFETAWWGEGVDRAVDYVNAEAGRGDAVDRACIEPAHLAWFREDLWPAMTQDARAARWIVAYAPLTAACPVPPDAALVYEVANDGLVLARVYRR